VDQGADKTFYTVTMARVFTSQGRYADAIRIYRYLLDRSPDRSDLQDALDAVASRLADESGQWPDIFRLIERWVRIMLKRNVIRRLRQYHAKR